ncbi:Ig-like domain-containing protein [Brooklawnia cerclae]|uniref:Lipoprotein-anchoring transpeptidase ErfK/SrfK n=1 Tax=Brooklawnia cerclae TaxID=349934 RepID=A0ABX0SKX8_9ACTN|nr:Ig-like domain-containing protein [Brooklawnia cerclae]NIH58666.1 lipoprotein-anchoring transpeptidase ErfK/SrfK [Brooklawnia cerclae]
MAPPNAFSRRTLLAGAAVVTLVGCASEPSDSDDPTAGAGSGTPVSPSAASTVAPTVQVTAEHGFDAMWPQDILDIQVSGGTVSKVTVTSADGGDVPGTLTGAQWKPERNFLVRATYTITVEAENESGVAFPTTVSATTIDPEFVTEVDFRYADGQIGNGMPVWVRFDMSVTDEQRAAIEKTATITTVPAQEGSWGWMDDTTLAWRPRDYWQAGSTAHVEVKAAGLPAADTWVLADAAADYQFGDLRVLKTDIDNHSLTCLRNGNVDAVIPVSLGKPGDETMTGTKLIMEKEYETIMDSESYGVDNESADGYKVTVYWNQRITWSGEYFHAAPWADAYHGNTNVSHGCTGMTTDNATWLYNWTQIGDPAEFTGTSAKGSVPAWDTYGCWTYDWETWKTLSAVA